MEIRQLEYFLMVSKVNSFTRAAERLYVSQPAVTTAIRNLEDELGIRLFDRSQKHAMLTTEGKIFYAHVDKLMQGISNTINEINALKGLNSGVLQLGLTPFGGLGSCTRLLKNFMESYPNIGISIHEDRTEELQRLIVDDKLDMAIAFEGSEINLISYIKLSREELVVCCPRQHRFKRFNSISIDELRDENLILVSGDSSYRRQIDSAFVAADLKPRVVLELDHVQTIKELVAEGCGITLLPECLCEFDQNVATTTLDPPIYLQTLAAYKTNRYQSHAAKAIISLAKELNNDE